MRIRFLATLWAVLLLFLTAGCFVRSLYPLYTEQDIVFEPGLVGRWNDDGDAVWTFSRGKGKSYELVIIDDSGNRDPFTAHLVRIEENLFLDLLPGQAKLEGTDFYKSLFLPIHTFCYVKQIEPTLQMRAPDLDWLEKYLDEHPDALRHEKLQEKIVVTAPPTAKNSDAVPSERTQVEIILTAPPKELQAFFLEHLRDEGAFGESSNMKRLE